MSLWDKVSIWYGAVIRGDRNSVKIGNCTNVQDHAVICTVPSLDSGFPATVDIGNLVTIGESALCLDHTLLEVKAKCSCQFHTLACSEGPWSFTWVSLS